MELSSYVADISGHQRKVVNSSVRPVRPGYGDAGIPVRNGKTLPFVVERAWNAPAGQYPERWYLVEPDSREVLHEGPSRLEQIWGLLSWTELSDEVGDPIALEAGSYTIVFSLGGIMGGQIDVEAFEASEDD